MSFETMIRIQDISVLLSGFLLGVIFLSCRMAISFKRVYISKDTKGKKINLIKLKDEKTGEQVYYINPETFRQSLELFFTLLIFPTSRDSNVLVQNSKKQNTIFISYIIIIILAILGSLYAISDIIVVHGGD